MAKALRKAKARLMARRIGFEKAKEIASQEVPKRAGHYHMPGSMNPKKR